LAFVDNISKTKDVCADFDDRKLTAGRLLLTDALDEPLLSYRGRGADLGIAQDR
jgi:hypothetical protein